MIIFRLDIYPALCYSFRLTLYRQFLNRSFLAVCLSLLVAQPFGLLTDLRAFSPHPKWSFLFFQPPPSFLLLYFFFLIFFFQKRRMISTKWQICFKWTNGTKQLIQPRPNFLYRDWPHVFASPKKEIGTLPFISKENLLRYLTKLFFF